MPDNNPKIKQLLSIQEAANLLSTDEYTCSVANIYFWIGKGELNFIKRGSHTLVFLKEIKRRIE